jgi:hypothetical protein
MEPSPAGMDRFNDPADIAFNAHVGAEKFDARKVSGRLAERYAENFCAFQSETLRDRAPDAGRSAGHDSRFPAELPHMHL